MKHILVPTDFSNNSLNALAYAIAIYQNTICSFYLLHVGSLKDSVVASNKIFPSISTKENLTNQKLKTNLSKLKPSSSNANHHFFTLLEYGNFIDKIRETSTEKKIDLIVMGTKGASGIKEAVIGSNAGDVITKVSINLLVVPEKAKFEGLKEISFPTDFNIFYSYSILNVFSEIKHLDSIYLRVLNVATRENLNDLQLKNKAYLQDFLEEVFEEAHSFHRLKNTKVKNAIEDFSNNGKTDIIMMVAKNLNFLQQILFDSTIKKLSFHSKIPLYIIHE